MKNECVGGGQTVSRWSRISSQLQDIERKPMERQGGKKKQVSRWWSGEDEKTNGSKLKDYSKRRRRQSQKKKKWNSEREKLSPNEPNHNHSSFPRALLTYVRETLHTPPLFSFFPSYSSIIIIVFVVDISQRSKKQKNPSSLSSFVFTQHDRIDSFFVFVFAFHFHPQLFITADFILSHRHCSTTTDTLPLQDPNKCDDYSDFSLDWSAREGNR